MKKQKTKKTDFYLKTIYHHAFTAMHIYYSTYQERVDAGQCDYDKKVYELYVKAYTALDELENQINNTLKEEN